RWHRLAGGGSCGSCPLQAQVP
ncbi:MAG: hypothetical protein CMN29_22125, partial [Sandaracinus sp.]|nr:hypothetical protein [Sandaracinus sp.]